MKSNKKIILTIEDDKVLRKLLKAELIRAGFQVLEARDGQEGIVIAKDKQPDLILLDLMLSTMPGEKVLKEVGVNKLTRNIPVIVLTLKADEASKINCQNILGARDYLIKCDVTLDEVVSKITQELSLNQKNVRANQ
ncbi:response regulator [Candidatus Parcubacteria bacterium]|nr:response regulator [Candidatus Parcubacteria bacterium]